MHKTNQDHKVTAHLKSQYKAPPKYTLPLSEFQIVLLTVTKALILLHSSGLLTNTFNRTSNSLTSLRL